MYKDLLVPLMGVDGDNDAVDFAASLAMKLEARLVVLTIVDLPVPTAGPWGVMQEVGLVDVYQTLRKEGEKTVAAMHARLEQEPIRFDVRLVETLTSEPDRIAAIASHYFDLIVVAGGLGASSEASSIHAYIGRLLMECGSPVLMVPPGSPSANLPPRRVVIGWKPTREAIRAVHDALPFLQVAEKVDLLIVDPTTGERELQVQLGNDLAAHLSHHGVRAEVVTAHAGEETVGTTLIKHAARIDADLIVVGGYGHSRLREWVFGGVTHELLGRSVKPVLFSH